jgi:hypothetical protein
MSKEKPNQNTIILVQKGEEGNNKDRIKHASAPATKPMKQINNANFSSMFFSKRSWSADA